MESDHLATLVRAIARLQVGDVPDADLVDALATLISRPAPAPAARERRPPFTLPARTGRAAGGGDAEVPSAPSPQRPRTAPPDRRVADSVSRRDDGRLIARPSNLEVIDDRADLAAPRRAETSDTNPADYRATAPVGPESPLESLFPPGRVRGILRELTTVTSASGPPDIAAAIELMARATPIELLPRKQVTTLCHSIQLLFDAGPAMLPFARDKQQLSATTLRLFGRDRVRVADFISSPLQRVRAQRQVRWDDLRWPARGSALVVVSDLGIGAGTSETHADEWRHFVEQADSRGLRSIVLIPYERDRWPTAAAAFGTALTWDLDTGVQALHRRARQRRRHRSP